MITLPPCSMMVFQGQPFKDEAFESAITELWDVMKTFNPELYGFEWADEDAPRFQMKPARLPRLYRGTAGAPNQSINAFKKAFISLSAFLFYIYLTQYKLVKLVCFLL